MSDSLNAKQEAEVHVGNDESTMPALDWKCPRCEEAIAEWDDCPHCGWDPYPEIPDWALSGPLSESELANIALVEKNLEISVGN